MPGGASKGKVKKHFKAKHQKKRVFRSSDPILSVFMWGVNHTVSIIFYGTCMHSISHLHHAASCVYVNLCILILHLNFYHNLLIPLCFVFLSVTTHHLH